MNSTDEIKEKLLEQIEMIKKLKYYSEISIQNNKKLSNVEKQITKDITHNTIDAMINSTNFLTNESQTILQNAISLRYVLEILIVTTLLRDEKGYKFVMYLGFYQSQILRQQAMIDELKLESERLDKWNEKWRAESLEYITKNGEPMPTGMRDRRQTILFKEFSRLELNIYSDLKNLESHTFSGLSWRIKNEIIPNYQSKIEELKKKKKEVARELVKEPVIKSLFPNIGLQQSKVFKEISDKNGEKGARSWFEKAKDANLEEEYKFMYSLTSNLSHYASYSMMTSNMYGVDEELILLRRLNIYLKRIYENLMEFSQIGKNIDDLFDGFGIIDLIGDY
ncbi:hypothetical protein [Lactococcus lactis]|uniref:hypothetical protein n=1 Tax=Lactococcus lactis TaxID=1358 RepID=UPI003D0C15F8